MPTLDEWQQRLEGHFAQLAAMRSGSGFPLFALEHGLGDEEVLEIAALLRERLALNQWLHSHWLAWVVYATEFGYAYQGDEYWQSFEELTPHWRERVSRDQLRDWFFRFRRMYNGVKPSGPWAESFSIISWPITHAILPRYLQEQFARSLHDQRYQLARADRLSASAAGHLLTANAWDTSSRFQEFLQQEELAGRIVLALLTERNVEGQSPIYPPALQRVVSDLEKVRSAREWLRETRSYVISRLKGASRGYGRVSELGERSQGPHENIPASIRPSLVVRRSGFSTWSVVIEIPNFASLARQSPDFQTFLRTTRCQIAGSGETWLPAGWLLSGAQKRVLKSWPGSNAPLVRFERANDTVDDLVRRETRISPGRMWVCRIAADGLGHEILGRIVRPGRKYVLLSEAELVSDLPCVSPTGIDCEGISAAVLSMPMAVSPNLARGLEALGVEVARTIRIWPAGLAARNWDGEGRTEWLTTESPCFGVLHDYPLDSYVLRLDFESETFINAQDVGYPIFVRISPLPPGRHTLSVKARRIYQPGTPPSPAAEGVVTLDVREPEPWLSGAASCAGMAITIDPPDVSLDTFWEGHVGLSVLGPVGRQITCSVSLKDARGAELLSETIGTFELPVSEQEWQKKLSNFVSDERRTWTYLEASSGVLAINGDELGQYARRLDRDAKPIRWICRRAHGTMTVRLIDDTGRDDPVTCRFFSFHGPADGVTLVGRSPMTGISVQAPGGLFDATTANGIRDAIVASAPQIQGGLKGLIIEPNLKSLQLDAVQDFDVMDHLRVWIEARLFGPLAGIRRDRIVQRLLNALYSRLCGWRWGEAENAYLSNPKLAATVQNLQRAVGGSPGFAAVLRREWERMDERADAGAVWFAEVAGRYQICPDKGLCDFALQLASCPHHLLRLPRPVLSDLLLEIRQKSVLLRGARLLALVCATSDPLAENIGLPRWKWR